MFNLVVLCFLCCVFALLLADLFFVCEVCWVWLECLWFTVSLVALFVAWFLRYCIVRFAYCALVCC